MAGRRQPSSITKQPPEIRELIGRLRTDGRTIDEIMAKLGELDVEVSRSALGRHVKKIAEVGEQLQRSRAMAEALTAKFGDQPDNKVARLNIELMHDMIFRIVTAQEEGEDDDGSRQVTFDPEEAMFLGRTLQSLASAQKTDFDRVEKAEKRAADKATREAAAKAVTAARSLGLSKDGVASIRHAVLGSDG